jgi:hypothetical protein
MGKTVESFRIALEGEISRWSDFARALRIQLRYIHYVEISKRVRALNSEGYIKGIEVKTLRAGVKSNRFPVNNKGLPVLFQNIKNYKGCRGFCCKRSISLAEVR